MQFALECTDREGTTICCSEGSWNGHIIERHPEIANYKNQVKLAIEAPLHIYQDIDYSDRRLMYRHAVFHAPFDREYLSYIVVVVSYHEQGAWRCGGNVITAWISDNFTRRHVLIWEKPRKT